MINRISDRLTSLFGNDAKSYVVHKRANGFVYVYPSAYGELNGENEYDAYSKFIVVDGRVVKDEFGLFGKGFQFQEKEE